jgi:hypothetical protein
MELKVNELRIGNLVSHYGFIRRIEAIHAKKKLDDKHRIIEFENGVTDFLMNVKPIELTEEWLEKFGFQKIDGAFFKLSFLFYGIKVKDDIGFHFKKGEFSIKLKYVHQLQNLYFTLVEEELKYELDQSNNFKIN